MKTKRTIKWGLLVAVATAAAVTAMSGCELAVEFDRSKIPQEEAGLEDGGTDGTTGDGPTTDGPGPDSTTEAGGDSSTVDSGGRDSATVDSGMDAVADSAADVQP